MVDENDEASTDEVGPLAIGARSLPRAAATGDRPDLAVADSYALPIAARPLPGAPGPGEVVGAAGVVWRAGPGGIPLASAPEADVAISDGGSPPAPAFPSVRGRTRRRPEPSPTGSGAPLLGAPAVEPGSTSSSASSAGSTAAPTRAREPNRRPSPTPSASAPAAASPPSEPSRPGDAKRGRLTAREAMERLMATNPRPSLMVVPQTDQAPAPDPTPAPSPRSDTSSAASPEQPSWPTGAAPAAPDPIRSSPPVSAPRSAVPRPDRATFPPPTPAPGATARTAWPEPVPPATRDVGRSASAAVDRAASSASGAASVRQPAASASQRTRAGAAPRPTVHRESPTTPPTPSGSTKGASSWPTGDATASSAPPAAGPGEQSPRQAIIARLLEREARNGRGTFVVSDEPAAVIPSVDPVQPLSAAATLDATPGWPGDPSPVDGEPTTGAGRPASPVTTPEPSARPAERGSEPTPRASVDHQVAPPTPWPADVAPSTPVADLPPGSGLATNPHEGTTSRFSERRAPDARARAAATRPSTAADPVSPTSVAPRPPDPSRGSRPSTVEGVAPGRAAGQPRQHQPVSPAARRRRRRNLGTWADPRSTRRLASSPRSPPPRRRAPSRRHRPPSWHRRP